MPVQCLLIDYKKYKPLKPDVGSMSHQTFTPAATVFIFIWICASACMPVLAISIQTDPTKDIKVSTTSARNEIDQPTFEWNTRVSEDDKSLVTKMTQDGKGVGKPSSSLTLNRLLGGNGSALVRRQVGQNDDFSYCSSNIIDPNFVEPSECQFGGDSFRLCLPGQYKITKCIKDTSNYCTFCTPEESFMTDNNNCTECKPCRTCGPDEQVAVACTIHDDTKCEPRPPVTGGPSCPPCPITQVTVASETATQLSTSHPEATSSLYTSPVETTVPTPTHCPECICNCSVCEKVPDTLPSAACPERTYFHIVVGFLPFVIIMFFIVFGILVWRHFKHSQLESDYRTVADENIKLKRKLQEHGIEWDDEKTNGVPPRCQEPRQDPANEGMEMGESIGAHNVSIDQRDANGNISQLPLLPEDEHGQTCNSDEPMSLSSLDCPRQISASKNVGSSHNPGPSSTSALVQADIHTPNDDGERTLDHPGRFENPGYLSSSTLPCDKPVGQLNPEDTQETEPTESDPLIVQQSSQASKLGERSDQDKKQNSGCKLKPESSIEITGLQNSPGASGVSRETSKGLASGASTSNGELHAEVDKNPPAKSPHLSSSSKDRQKGLTLPIESSLNDRESPVGIGSVTSPVAENTDLPSIGGPKLGVTPTSETPGGPLNQPKTTMIENPPTGTSASNAGDVAKHPSKPKSSIDGTGDSQKAGATSKEDGKKLPNGSPIKFRTSADETSQEHATIKPKTSGEVAGKEKDTKPSPEDEGKIADDLDFETVGKQLTPEALRSLYRHLRLNEATVARAEEDCSSSLFLEKGISVLKAWRRKAGRFATRKAIIDALRKGEQNEYADELADMWK